MQSMFNSKTYSHKSPPCTNCYKATLLGDLMQVSSHTHKKKNWTELVSCSIFASYWGFTLLSKEENIDPCQCLCPPAERAPSEAAGMTDSCSSLSLSWAKSDAPKESRRRSAGPLSKPARFGEITTGQELHSSGKVFKLQHKSQKWWGLLEKTESSTREQSGKL